MTEDDAKTKFCPMAHDGMNCLGSGCMWWRWCTEYDIDEPGLVDSKTDGFCGGCHGRD